MPDFIVPTEESTRVSTVMNCNGSTNAPTDCASAADGRPAASTASNIPWRKNFPNRVVKGGLVFMEIFWKLLVQGAHQADAVQFDGSLGDQADVLVRPQRLVQPADAL